MKNWYKVTVRYVKEQEDGSLKKLTESYLFDAVCFKEAEELAHEEIGATCRGEFQVASIKEEKYSDVIVTDEEEWFDVKYRTMNVDADSGKEKWHTVKILVNAYSLTKAMDYAFDEISRHVSVFTLASIAKTKIIDVFSQSENV